ncbi:unnamed protein product, partial [Adineta steineri]
NKRPIDDSGDAKSMKGRIREFKETLNQRDQQLKNLESLVTKLMLDLEKHEAHEETFKKN